MQVVLVLLAMEGLVAAVVLVRLVVHILVEVKPQVLHQTFQEQV
jgi:hypothetical protein